MFTVLCSMLLSSCWWNKDETPTVMVDDGRVVPVFSADNNASLTFVSPDDGSVDVSGHMHITFLWDAPVFALQDPQTTQAFLHEHITIEPETPGSWYLVGSTGIVFEPREQWKPSNEYTVTMDAKGF